MLSIEVHVKLPHIFVSQHLTCIVNISNKKSRVWSSYLSFICITYLVCVSNLHVKVYSEMCVFL